MDKRKQSKLARHTEQLDEWFGKEELTLAAVRERLAQAGCSVSLARLSDWRINRDWERRREQVLNQIAAGARHCGQLEEQFGKNPPPELEILIKLHRVIILQLSAQMHSNPDAVRSVTTLMKPVMDWARLEEKRKDRELAEQKYRDEVEAQKSEAEREDREANKEGGLSPETLEKIERELKLM